MKKTIAIWSGILLMMCFVIYVPVMEENYHIKNDPHYLDGKYQLRRNLNDYSYYTPVTIQGDQGTPIKVDTVNKK